MLDVNKRYDNIQILRAVLFIGIAAFHSGVPGSQILWGGVEIFFVISSYFLTKKLSKVSVGEIELIPNITHRITRLMPVYYLVLIGVVLVVVILKQTVPIGDLLIHGLFSQNINWMFTGYKSALVRFTAHTWTLSIEVYLFVVWLLAFKLLKTVYSRQIFNAASIVGAVAWRTITVVAIGDPMITSLCPVAHMDAFGIGSLMALSEKEQSKKGGPLNWILGLCGLGIVAGSVGTTAYLNGISLGAAYNLYNSSDNYLNSVLTCNVYLGFSLLAVKLVQVSKLFRVEGKLSHLLIALGDITYSTYLIHYPVNVVLKVVCKNVWIVFFLTISVSIVCTVIIKKMMIYINENR